MDRERRQYSRTKPGAGYRIDCYSTDFRREGSSRHSLAIKFIDFSSKGACIVTPGRLRRGITLMVQVRHVEDRSRFKGKAVVRWSETLRRNGKEAHIAGLEFTDVLEARGERMTFLRQWARGLGLITPDEIRRKRKRAVLEKARVQMTPSSVMKAVGLPSNAAWCVVDLSESKVHLVANRRMKPGRAVSLKIQFGLPAVTVRAEGTVTYSERNLLSLEPRYPTEIKLTKLSDDDAARLRLVLKSFDPE